MKKKRKFYVNFNNTCIYNILLPKNMNNILPLTILLCVIKLINIAKNKIKETFLFNNKNIMQYRHV